ncbi:DUF3558 family protein [Saccharopolyspora oryzae]|uniref:DUF3558 family protein n=1 Tax=Saccharopolyspora oryzae TaxID=2997343 RepID=A0ABT4V0U2_9PSEU|nr:DUF3558 family protein [Saccharopolyspora oryzae]MDA3627591.1 DUF3558 family protein [Saccharopolyspora oryzae]
MIAAVAGASLLGLSACSGGGSSSGSEESPTSAAAGAGLASFDPCTFFEPGELTSWGLSTQSEDFSPVKSEPGCKWDGDQMGLALQKNAEESVASYQQSGSWERYDKKTIGGRSAAIANEPGTVGQGSCTVLVDAGGGVAIYMVDGTRRDSVDACAEAEKIANQTASRLPE